MPTILLLGATSDMGFAIAKKFASEKFDVQLAARNSSVLEPHQKDIQIRYG
ncbi:MAG: short-chain dehydrogenase, partial [Flavisolibacter sp.]|nr:short-chain dehydrogenase [Flavisolibacter sp.]